MKQLLLALVAATFALSVSAGKPTKEQFDAGAAERGKPSKEQIAECNAKKDAKEKKACEQRFGIAVSDPGTPSDKPTPAKSNK
jgi:hypothetical protein